MFFLAIIFNLLSSYLIASIFGNFLIIFIAFFALIILNIEVLSLFGAIKELNAFIFSFLNLLITTAFFKYKNSTFLKINFDFKRLKNALVLDKSLLIMSIAFVSMLLTTLIFALIMPAIEPDSQTYHFIRAFEFVKQGSLAHFETNDIRALIMPINSEIFYSWLLLFKKNFHGYGILSYFAYILSICSLWSVFEEFKFSFRKRLYALFLFSSLSAIIIQAQSMQTDIVVGALLISAFALFIKNKLYFSSLALSLALGVKSTGFISLFGFFIVLFLYEKLITKKVNYKKLIHFSLQLFINFLIFSSYNYILNFIHFGNPFANQAAYIGHKFWGGFKGYIANLIHFAFQSLDFTGFKWGFYLNNEILNIKNQFFNLINIDASIGCNVKQDIVNIFTDEQRIGFGILGFLVFIPSLFKAIINFFLNKNKRTILCFILAIAFIINVLFLARATAYMVYSIRFIVAFVCLSAIVLIFTYKKKSLLKPLIVFFSVFYMLLIPLHNARMPFINAFVGLKNAKFNLNKFENDCFEKKVVRTSEISSKLYKTIKEKYSDKKNIAYIKTLATPALYLKKLEYEGYNVVFFAAGNINKEKLKSFDLIILDNETQSDNIFNPKDIEETYKIENGKIIYKNNDAIKCAFVYPDYINTKAKDAIERHCFTYEYIQQNKDLNLKLDYFENINFKEISQKFIVYYFINRG